MRKLLSIVISILMISAMMSAVAFADGEATITLAGTQTGLVAGEAVTLTPTITVDGATTYTVEVNSQVFGITGGSAVAGKTIIKKENIPVAETFELTVNKQVPASFDSEIKITAGAVSQKFTISANARLLGDVDGDGAVTSADAAEVLKAEVGYETVATYMATAANVDGDESVTSADAAELLKYEVGYETVNANIGVTRVATSMDIVDPFVNVTPDPVKLSTPANVYAYYQDGKLYYTFDAVSNAVNYTITVGAETFNNVTATSGSLTLANAWDGTGTLAVTVTAIGDETNYTNSDAANVSGGAVFANVSGQLSQWLADNNLSDVAITVYEITAE